MATPNKKARLGALAVALAVWAAGFWILWHVTYCAVVGFIILKVAEGR